jgi:hypothetical protein
MNEAELASDNCEDVKIKQEYICVRDVSSKVQVTFSNTSSTTPHTHSNTQATYHKSHNSMDSWES